MQRVKFKRRTNEPRIYDKLLKINRVSKAVKGGRKVSFCAIIVAGNKRGLIGVGIGKASEVSEAIKKAKRDAKKTFMNVQLTRKSTIPHFVKGQFGGAKVLILPAKEGTGVIAGGAVRAVLELAGLKNVLAKQLGSDNLLNNARATLNAFDQLKSTTQYANLRGVAIEELTTRVPRSRLVISTEKIS